MPSAFLTLVKALPEILALIKTIQIAYDKQQAVQKVKEDINAIHDAFKTGDASKLNALFNRG